MDSYQVYKKYYSKSAKQFLSEEEEFFLIEAMQELMRMPGEEAVWEFNLASYYQENGFYELAEKYFRKLHEGGIFNFGYDLGTLYYEGIHGVPDYEKAIHYFQYDLEYQNMDCQARLAEMYRLGQGVQQDNNQYDEFMFSLYERSLKSEQALHYLPYTSYSLYRYFYYSDVDLSLEISREYLQLAFQDCYRLLNTHYRIQLLKLMEKIIVEVFNNHHEDWIPRTIYDLLFILKTPCKVRLRMNQEVFEVSSQIKGNNLVILFDNNWFRSPLQLFEKASIQGFRVSTLGEELDILEVL